MPGYEVLGDEEKNELLELELFLRKIKEKLAKYKVPSHVEFRDELPKTTVGKILRRELVRQHNEAGE